MLPRGTLLPGVPAQHGWNQLPEAGRGPGLGAPPRGGNEGPPLPTEWIGPWAGGPAPRTHTLPSPPPSPARAGRGAHKPEHFLGESTAGFSQAHREASGTEYHPYFPHEETEAQPWQACKAQSWPLTPAPELPPPCCPLASTGVFLSQVNLQDSAGMAGTTLCPALELPR